MTTRTDSRQTEGRRIKLLAGNWKMNLGPKEARALIRDIRLQLDPLAAQLARRCEVMVAPPFVSIQAAAQAAAGAAISLSAQNMHFLTSGAFTGEISAPMLVELGVRYVILGHSERRHIFGETDAAIRQKIATAFAHKLVPVLCVGETEGERDAGRTLEVIERQFASALEAVDAESAQRMVIAYEPVWAIGTGRSANAQQAEQVHGALRGLISGRLGREAAHRIRILYGGSVTPDNVDSLVSKPDIDGALVGGASLKADSFVRIVRAALRAAESDGG